MGIKRQVVMTCPECQSRSQHTFEDSEYTTLLAAVRDMREKEKVCHMTDFGSPDYLRVHFEFCDARTRVDQLLEEVADGE